MKQVCVASKDLLVSRRTCARGVSSHCRQRRPQTYRCKRSHHCQQRNLPAASLLVRASVYRLHPPRHTLLSSRVEHALGQGTSSAYSVLLCNGRVPVRTDVHLVSLQGEVVKAKWALPATVQGARGARRPTRQTPGRAEPLRCTLVLPSAWPHASQLPHRAASLQPGAVGAQALQQEHQAQPCQSVAKYIRMRLL